MVSAWPPNHSSRRALPKAKPAEPPFEGLEETGTSTNRLSFPVVSTTLRDQRGKPHTMLGAFRTTPHGPTRYCLPQTGSPILRDLRHRRRRLRICWRGRQNSFAEVNLGFNPADLPPKTPVSARLAAVLFDMHSANLLVAAGVRAEHRPNRKTADFGRRAAADGSDCDELLVNAAAPSDLQRVYRFDLRH